jgi:hypothetical protein
VPKATLRYRRRSPATFSVLPVLTVMHFVPVSPIFRPVWAKTPVVPPEYAVPPPLLVSDRAPVVQALLVLAVLALNAA